MKTHRQRSRSHLALLVCAPVRLGRIVLAAAALVPLLAFSAGAAEPGEGVYVVNMQRVIERSIIGKAARNDIEAEAKKREADFLQKRKGIEAANVNLQKQKSLLSKEALQQRTTELRERAAALAQEMEKNRADLNEMMTARLDKVVAEVRSVVAEISAKENIATVIDGDPNAVVYISPERDLTDQVVTKLNERKLAL